jgi:hypothetical protein
MDIKKLADVKDRFADYEKIFNSGDYDKAADILSAILERIEECTDERKAGTMDDTFVKKSDMDGRPIYLMLLFVFSLTSSELLNKFFNFSFSPYGIFEA